MNNEKLMMKLPFLAILAVVILAGILLAPLVNAKDIIHDSEFQILQKQHGDKWAAEDKDIQKKLAALHKQVRQ